MGFFKSLFSPPESEAGKTPEVATAEKKRIAFDTLRDSGVRAIGIKEYKLAAGYFEKALELNADSGEVKALLAEAYLKGGDMQKAFDLLCPIAEENPENPRVWISLAQAAMQLTNWEDMLEAANETERLEPENPSAYYLQGRAYMGLEDYCKAGECFGKALGLDGDYA